MKKYNPAYMNQFAFDRFRVARVNLPNTKITEKIVERLFNKQFNLSKFDTNQFLMSLKKHFIQTLLECGRVRIEGIGTICLAYHVHKSGRSYASLIVSSNNHVQHDYKGSIYRCYDENEKSIYVQRFSKRQKPLIE